MDFVPPYSIPKESFTFFYSALYVMMALTAVTSAYYYDYRTYNTFIETKDRYAAKIAVASLIVLIGFRAYNVGTDTRNYYIVDWIRTRANKDSSEVLFVFLINTLKQLQFSFTAFLLVVAFLFYYFIYKSYSRFANFFKANLFWMLFSFISMFFAKSISINVIRQGVSLAFLLYALSLYITDRKKVLLITVFCMLAFITHSTSIIPILLFLFVVLTNSKIELRYYYILFVLGIVISISNYGLKDVLPSVADFVLEGSRVNYLNDSDTEFTVGFKPQFVAFNTVFLAYFYNLTRNFFKPSTVFEKTYILLLKYYLFASFIFFMAFQLPYSDRWGLFSWMLIPILMAPYFTLKKSKLKSKSLIVLFFVFIYFFFQLYF